MPARPVLLVVALLGLPSAACGTKASVSLACSIESPRLEVAEGDLVASVEGGLTLVLALGEHASEPTSVSLGGFALQRDGRDVLTPLPWDDAGFPIRVGIGETKRVPLVFSREEPEGAGALCAGALEYVGTVDDSLGGESATPARSAPFTPSCSP